MKNYKYTTAYEWFSEKVEKWNEQELKVTLPKIIRFNDADSIQDLFQEEMNSDGYFENEDKYPTAFSWILEKNKKWNQEKLVDSLKRLIKFVDADDIQFLFQEEMDSDGYFEIIKK